MMVAHPDDETLWSGGLLLMHPSWHCRIHTLCRASDVERAARFHQVLQIYGAAGGMADCDDEPAQYPLDPARVEAEVLNALGSTPFDLLLTHGPQGEYTWHRRHVEVSSAVMRLWMDGRLLARRMCLFAYEDGQKSFLPRPRADATVHLALPADIWREKYRLVHEIYGFAADSWEARTTPRTEAFWQFASPEALTSWLNRRSNDR